MVPSRNEGVAQLRRGAIENCVLALLRGTEKYGFEIVKELSEIDGLVTSEGTIYPLLTRLRDEGLVTSSWRESRTGPPRRYYRLTATGEQALDVFADEWGVFKRAVDRVLRKAKQ